jgi:myosin I
MSLQKPRTASPPRPAARSLPGQSTHPPPRPSVRVPPSTAASVPAPPKLPQSKALSGDSSGIPPPPPPPPLPGKAAAAPPAPPPPPSAVPSEPEKPLYKAKFAFQGQDGEMSLKKEDLVELLDKDDNGWWLVKNGNVEGWAPSNYLELVAPKPKDSTPPPLPGGRRPPALPAASATRSTPKPSLHSVTADAGAKPVAVFPGMAAANGSAAPWKKNVVANTSASDEATPASSRPSSTVGGKTPPPVAAKPKPPAPPVSAKPKVPGAKPPVLTAPRPISSAPAAPPRPGVKAAGGPAAPGQMDLAAAVSSFQEKNQGPQFTKHPFFSLRDVLNEWRMTID